MALAATLTLLLGPLTSAAAAPSREQLDPVPAAGFGSASDPMTPQHASGGFPFPIVRVFNPCHYFGGDAYHRLTRVTALLDDNGVFPTLRNWGTPYKVWLRCSKVSIDPFSGGSILATCKTRGHIIRDSWGFSHQAGPIILPVSNILSRENSQWVYDFSLYNIGWVTSDTSVWWLCNEGTQE